MVHKAYKYELRPTSTQLVHLNQHAGCARFAYNWGLEQRSKRYKKNREKLNAIKLHKELNKLKKTTFQWMYGVSKCAPQEALRDLDKAYANFFDGRKKGRRVGYPKFKKKGKRDSFRLTGTIKILDNNQVKQLDKVQLPRLGKIRVKETTKKLRDKLHNNITKILSATICGRADRWFVSFTVDEIMSPNPQEPRGIVGVDLGLKELAVLSNGETIPNPKPLKRKLKKLRRINRKLSRAQKGSSKRRKVIDALRRLHYRIGTQRSDLLHKLTTDLTKKFGLIVIEDLNVKGMMKNKRLARSIADVGWGEFRRQLEYKATWYDSKIMVADRFYPSSKLCSGCSWKDVNLLLFKRIFTCQSCGLQIDRDLNAAYNLQSYPINNLEQYLFDICCNVPDDEISSVAMSYHETLNACVRPSKTSIMMRGVDDPGREVNV